MKILAQIGGTSRTALRKAAIGDREGPRSTSLWPRAYPLSFGEPVFSADDHSKSLKLTGLYWRARRNAQRIIVKRNDVRFAALPPLFDGYTILHISDMHVDMNEAAMRHLIEIVGRHAV